MTIMVTKHKTVHKVPTKAIDILENFPAIQILHKSKLCRD